MTSGKYRRSALTRERMRRAKLGKHHSESTKEKMRRAKLGRRNPMYGHKHSDTVKRQISEKMRGLEY